MTRGAQFFGLVVAVTATFLASTSHGAAATTPSVSLSPGPYHDGQSITVSGKGFPGQQADPSGLQVIECADPAGTAANLPVDASTCDGATENPLPLIPAADGTFSTSYVMSALNGAHGAANINCGSSDFCVLWVGEDYNDAFTSGPHAFSAPFEVGAAIAPTPTPTTPPTSAPAASPAPDPASLSTASDQPGAPTLSGASEGSAALASTGMPALLPVLAGLGLGLAGVGTAGRRRLARRVA